MSHFRSLYINHARDNYFLNFTEKFLPEISKDFGPCLQTQYVMKAAEIHGMLGTISLMILAECPRFTSSLSIKTDWKQIAENPLE